MDKKGQYGFKIPSSNIFGTQKKRKRTLSRRDKEILYQRAKGRCEICGRKMGFPEMQVGHDRAYSKGGATTLANSKCICYTCNKLHGRDRASTLKKKLSGTYGKRTTTKKKKKNTRSKNPMNGIFGSYKPPRFRF